jgi:hypothetical protein
VSLVTSFTILLGLFVAIVLLIPLWKFKARSSRRVRRRSLGKALACQERVEAVAMFRRLSLSTAERISTWSIQETNGLSCGSSLRRQERSSLVVITRARTTRNWFDRLNSFSIVRASICCSSTSERITSCNGNEESRSEVRFSAMPGERMASPRFFSIRAGVSVRLATNGSLLDLPETVAFAQQLNLDDSDSLNHRVPKFVS